MIWDEPPGPWGAPAEASLDPFTVVYRGSNRRRKTQHQGNIYHMDANCPLLTDTRILRSRLGSVLAGGWRLCSLEANPFTWNMAPSQAELRQEGRLRALAQLQEAS